ncbi:alpha/beta fold hydrolase [Microbacterium paraoxydans]|uniref:alpha/beta fold hydrolase n=1 Tax=Microbacterium paraoxydans TaxID=199592 RepID=UPI001CFA8C9D|nr:alpha/beta hydrolase [Microbacterium paraoxydans]
MMTHRPPLPDQVFVDVGGVSVATRVLSPPGTSAGDVILCHGTPWSSLVWADAARELSREHRVFLWDMPGYGASQMGATVATDLSTQSARLASLVRGWGLERPHVVAHDIGGAVALGAHLRHRMDFASLFLWDIVTLDPWGSPFFRVVAQHADVFSRLPGNLHSALVREYIAGAGRLSAPQVEALASPWTGPVGQAAFYRQIASLDAADTHAVVEELGAVRCRTRIGWGREDPWIPLEQAYELQARLPGQPDVLVLDGAGHLTPWEKPEAVIDALGEWLEDSRDAPNQRGAARKPSPSTG